MVFPQNLKANIDDPAIFKCIHDGNAAWSFHNSLQNYSLDSVISVESGHIIFIEKVALEHYGKYSCTIFNQFSSKYYSEEVNLIVIG